MTRIVDLTSDLNSDLTSDLNVDLDLAESIVADGFGPHDAALIDLLMRARSVGVSGVLVGVAGDVSAPTVVRQRALGRIIHRMAAPAPTAGRVLSMALSARPVGAGVAA